MSDKSGEQPQPQRTGDPQEQVAVTHEGGAMRCSRCRKLVDDRFTATGIFVKGPRQMAVWCICDECINVTAERMMALNLDVSKRREVPIAFYVYGPAYVTGKTGREWYEYVVKEDER